MIAHEIVADLHGTSSEKLGTLLTRLRADKTASFGLGIAERVPGTFGEAVRWIVSDLPNADPGEVDAALAQVADFVLSLRSDSLQLVEGA